MVLAGERLFKTDGNCWACHGEDATGARGVGANLTDDEWWHSDGSYEAIVRTIGTGVPSDKVRNAYGAMMPPRGGSQLSDEQLRAVAAYVWSLRLLPVDSASPEGLHLSELGVDLDAAGAQELRGQFPAGKDRDEVVGHCFDCACVALHYDRVGLDLE